MERILNRIKVNEETGCWEWTGNVNNAGYGAVTVDNKHWTVHRYVYTKYYGEIPYREKISQKCKNRLCCNPEHLIHFSEIKKKLKKKRKRT